MTSICSFLKQAITDEKAAQEFYNKGKKVFTKKDQNKIQEIQYEEHVHQKELKMLSDKYKCK